MYNEKKVNFINELYNVSALKYTGKGICTAILDTGIYPHSDLKKQIVFFKDFVNDKISAYDDNSHGTHVAGIIAGNGSASNQSIRGIAPNSDIIALKILDKIGQGDKFTLMNACGWLISNHKKYNIRTINISIGANTNDCDNEKTEIIDMFDALWYSGVNIVISAGNSGPGPGTITFPGTYKNAITVGSYYTPSFSDRYKKSITSHSGEGPTKCNIEKPDILAPGHNIVSCHNKYNGYTVKSGTSMSTPIVSGTIGLFLEKNPEFTNIDIKKYIKSTATDLGLSVNRQGAGLLNIRKFLNTNTDINK